MSDEEIKKRVEEITTINFSITKCPHKVYKKFVEFCKTETNDNYSFGIKLLIDGMEANIKEAALYENYMILKERMDVLEEQINKPKEEEKKVKKLKTMGSGGLI